jgi:tetratricopeptide (TPR) repeat protein
MSAAVRRHSGLCAGAGLLVLLLVAAGSASEPLTPPRQREILQAALAAYDEAVASARENPARAAEQYRAAAAGLLALRDSGLRNAALEYNLGNTYFRLGELGRAVLHYRRAERLAPHDARLIANLRYARDQVEPRITATGSSRLAGHLLFWHYATSRRERFLALVFLSVVGWPLLLLWLRERYRELLGASVRRTLLFLGGVAVVLALAAGASLLWQAHDEALRPHAVVVGHEVPLRLGRGTGSDLALKQPLGPGVELRILQQRGGWLEVRLPNEQTGWLPEESVERIGL